MKILYFNNSAFGGLAQYAHYQANALVKQGCEVDFLCPPNFPVYPDTLYNRNPILAAKEKRTGSSKLSRLCGFYKEITYDIDSLVNHLKGSDSKYVLFGSYFEYFSPFWIRRLLKVKMKGIVFGAVVHDPIRDTKLGPTLWHQYSVRKAYDFLDILFLHQKVNDKSSGIPSNIPQHIVPHGPYSVNSSLIDYQKARDMLRIPTNKFMLLSFGHIRDNKNLHLTIECLKGFPEVHLVIAGQSLNESQKQPKDYQKLATDLGIENQISWFVDYIPDEEVGTYFSAADGILLTYSSGFHSASGVLNLTSTFRKPCIASSGPSALQELVRKYSLGVWVDPDNISALKAGLQTFFTSPPEPDWNGYQQDNSWQRNAKITAEAFRKT